MFPILEFIASSFLLLKMSYSAACALPISLEAFSLTQSQHKVVFINVT